MNDVTRAISLISAWAIFFAFLFFIVGAFSGIDSLVLASAVLSAIFLPVQLVLSK